MKNWLWCLFPSFRSIRFEFINRCVFKETSKLVELEITKVFMDGMVMISSNI